jgi:Ni/Co efflux regulator RcnB
MNKKRLIASALMAALLGAGAASHAQDRNRGDNDRHEQRDNHGDDRRGNDHRVDDRRGDDRRGNDNRGNDYRGNDRRADVRHDDRRGDGAGPNRNFHRGERLPTNYRSNQYVVNDWRGHKLRQPPRGYHWVQTGGDYVLAAIATGIIADLIINH